MDWNRYTVILAGALFCLSLGACSTIKEVLPEPKADYKKSRVSESLEVPPDLSTTTIQDPPSALDNAAAGGGVQERTTSLSGYTETQRSTAASAVLPQHANVRLERDEDDQWLVVDATPSQVWPKIRNFWVEQGFLISMEDPRIGIMETGWTENRADIPQDFIRGLLNKVADFVYSAATRDKYRVRIERGPAEGTTDIYLTQRGMEEVVTGSADDTTGTMWRPRPSDPELEAEMLKRLMVYLGVDEEMASSQLAQSEPEQERARLVTSDSGSMLVVDDGFSRTWRRTGIALDRVGFTVDDLNRTDGIYFVRYKDPFGEDDEGFMSKIAFWSSDDDSSSEQYQIQLIGEGATTNIVVNNDEGERENSGTARRILTVLQEQLR